MVKVQNLVRSEAKSLKRKMDKHSEHASTERKKIMRFIGGEGPENEEDNVLPEDLPSEEDNLANFEASTFVFDRNVALPRQLKLYWKGSRVQECPPLHLIQRNAFPASERNMYVEM